MIVVCPRFNLAKLDVHRRYLGVERLYNIITRDIKLHNLSPLRSRALRSTAGSERAVFRMISNLNKFHPDNRFSKDCHTRQLFNRFFTFHVI